MGATLPDRNIFLGGLMKRIIFLFIISLTFLNFFAEKIGYIDSKRIFQEYKGLNDINREVEKELADWKKKINNLQQQIDSLEKIYNEQKSMLSEELNSRKQKEINDKKDSLNKYIQEIYGEGGKSSTINKQMLKPVVDKINSIIKKIGDDEGYTLILDFADGNILYAKKEIDLTDRVIEELNKDFFVPVSVLQRYIVYDFVAEDKETRSEQYHIKLAKSLYQSLQVENKLEPVSVNDVNSYLQKMGVTDIENLKPVDALSYAFTLNADYCFMGRVKMVSGKIISEVSIYDVKTRRLLKTINKESTSDIDFNNKISEYISEIKLLLKK